MSEILLDKEAYKNNIKNIANKIGGVEKIILITKDNSYGHGSLLISEVAKELGITKTACKNLSEARNLRGFFEEIIILSHIPTGDEDEDFIYCINDLSNFRTLKSGLKIYIAIDTMMHRNGIVADELDEALKLCKDKNFNLQGFCTHYRSADEISSDFFAQRENFKNFKNLAKVRCAEFGFKNIKFHSYNSAAMQRSAEFSDEYMRLGIAQFGYSQFQSELNLVPILKLYADKISSRVLKSKQRVGYNGAFEAKNDMLISTYDLGYGDGLFRYNGEGEFCLPNGKKMLGKMSMDSFSTQGDESRILVIDDARVWAKFFGTIEYEILVKLSDKIVRRWI